MASRVGPEVDRIMAAVRTADQARAALVRASARVLSVAGEVAAADIDEELQGATVSMLRTAQTLCSRATTRLPSTDVVLEAGTLAEVRTAINQACLAIDQAVQNLNDPGIGVYFIAGLREAVAGATKGIGAIAGVAGNAAGAVLAGAWPLLLVAGAVLLVVLFTRGIV